MHGAAQGGSSVKTKGLLLVGAVALCLAGLLGCEQTVETPSSPPANHTTVVNKVPSGGTSSTSSTTTEHSNTNTTTGSADTNTGAATGTSPGGAGTTGTSSSTTNSTTSTSH